MELLEKVKSLNNTPTNSVDYEMLTASFDFWFNDHEEIRSPFPHYLREELMKGAVNNYSNWVYNLSEEAKKEINEEIHLEKFEEILFETALKLCISEDEKITIKYPFMIRINDVVEHDNKPISKAISRQIIQKDNTSFLEVEFLTEGSNEKWNTTFELME